jgi:RNA polymerase sigma factor (sigma-70 family)
MLDSEIVAAIVAGDADGLAAAYDRYAAPLHAFCCSLLTEPAGAADAVQDTFVIAAARLAGLRDRDRLKPWLYAVARNECRRRLRARHPDDPGGVSDDAVDFGIDLERAELREVVGCVIAALNPSEREVIELSLRQDFGADDLALALGVSGSQAESLAAGAGRQFEKSLGALLVARTGRVYCAKLDELLEGWDGQPTALLRKRLNLHIQHCRICSARRDRELAPAMLLSVLPVTAIARGLRQQVLELAASGTPDAVAYRAGVLQRAGAFEESGFPVPVDPPEPERRRRYQARAFAAVAVLAAMGAVGLELGQHHPHAQQPATAALGSQILAPQPRVALSPSQVPAARASAPARRASALAIPPGATPSISISLSPLPGLVPPSSTQTGSSSPPSSPSGRPPPPPPSSPPPSPSATVSASPASVTLGLSSSGGAPSGSFTLTASGGSVSYSIGVPAQYAAQLAVSPASGSLVSGSSVTITVTWQSSAALQTALSVGPGGQAVSVSYQPLLGPQGTARR